MELLAMLWDNYLYIPLFNLLVWLYTGWADYNLGVAIILLTIIIRIALLPFSLLVQRGKVVRNELSSNIRQIQKDHPNDPVKQKLAARQMLRHKKVRHWAKAVVLGVQALVLVLLYRVFISGVSSQIQLEYLYPGVVHPDFINTMFLGLDIAKKSLLLPAIVAGYIFGQILIRQWITKKPATKKELIFSIFFPAFSFLLLAILPAVKSVFILTSLIFSTIISMIGGMIKLAQKKGQVDPADLI